MSIELLPNPEQMPESVSRLKRYASDVAHADNYSSTVLATMEMLEAQFGLDSSQASRLLVNWQAAGVYPAENTFDHHPDLAADMLKAHLYRYILSGMESQSSTSEARTESVLTPKVYAQWVGATFAAMAYEVEDKQPRHSIEKCQPHCDRFWTSASKCPSNFCPLTVVVDDIQEELGRYRLDGDELRAAMKLEVETSSVSYMVSESMRLEIKLNQMQLHGLAPKRFTDQLQMVNRGARDYMRRDYFTPSI